MQEHQVDIVQFGHSQALIDLCLGAVIADVEDFGCEEDLASGDSRRADGVSAAFFVAVHRRGVDLCFVLTGMNRSGLTEEYIHGDSRP